MVASNAKTISKRQKRSLEQVKNSEKSNAKKCLDNRFPSIEDITPNKALQFADCTIGLTIRHLPILLNVGLPVALLLISLGSSWFVFVSFQLSRFNHNLVLYIFGFRILTIPFLALQIVAIFLCLEEPQG